MQPWDLRGCLTSRQGSHLSTWNERPPSQQLFAVTIRTGRVDFGLNWNLLRSLHWQIQVIAVKIMLFQSFRSKKGRTDYSFQKELARRLSRLQTYHKSQDRKILSEPRG